MSTHLPFVDLDCTQAGKGLTVLSRNPVKLTELLTPKRVAEYQIITPQWTYLYATALLRDEHLSIFQKLADEQACIAKYRSLWDGVPLNRSEGRGVAHHLTRDPRESGRYRQERKRIATWAATIRDQPYTDVLQIGIGGSDLGPRAVYRALLRYAEPKSLKAHFLSNIDPDQVGRLLTHLDPRKTLVLVVSKSGSTAETRSNWRQVKQWWDEAGLPAADQIRQSVSITLPGSILDDHSQFGQTFYFFEEIGGRFSVTSVAGLAVFSVALGMPVVDAVLAGA
ncbi:MAG: glucose-6-phosphate isomerase, partial [Candidatus Margulisiibacteriota bacterium]